MRGMGVGSNTEGVGWGKQQGGRGQSKQQRERKVERWGSKRAKESSVGLVGRSIQARKQHGGVGEKHTSEREEHQSAADGGEKSQGRQLENTCTQLECLNKKKKVARKK